MSATSRRKLFYISTRAAFAAFGPVVLAACNGTQPAAENMPVETPVLGVQTPEALAPKIETRAPVRPVEKVSTRIVEKTPVVQTVVQGVPQLSLIHISEPTRPY